MKKPTTKIAKFDTKCKHCGKIMKIGETIKVHHDNWVHLDCYDAFVGAVSKPAITSKPTSDTQRVFDFTKLFPVLVLKNNYKVTVVEKCKKEHIIQASSMEEAINEVKTKENFVEVISIEKTS